MIDANDEYLNNRATNIQVNKATMLNVGDKTIKIPKKVATPLPPLKLKKIGNIWPMTTAIAIMFIRKGLNDK